MTSCNYQKEDGEIRGADIKGVERKGNSSIVEMKRGRGSAWTAEESQKLKSAYFQHAGMWNLIARSFPNCTESALKNQWNKIKKGTHHRKILL